MRLVNWRALVVGAVGFGLAACGDDVTVAPTPITYTLNPSAVTCTTGQQTALGVTVAGGTGTPTITFTPQSTTVITGGTTNGSTFTFTCGNTPGASAIGFTIVSGGQTVTGSVPVTVNQGTQGTSQVTAISVNPSSATLVPGGTTTVTATVTLAAGAPTTTSTAATFSSSDTTVAKVVTNANGTATVTAVNNAANSGKQAVITAAAVANPNLKAFTTITIAPASAVVQSLQVSPTTVTLNVGGTQQLTSSVTLAAGAPAGTSTNVTCTSSNTAIITVSGGNGTPCTITAVANGTATVTVASVAAPTVAQQVTVQVAATAPVRLTIQGLQVVNAAGNLVPADLNNVVGNLFATLNLDPGSFTPDSVVATLGSQRIVCQRFTAQLAQALHDALTSGSADFAPITCQINTSAFDTTTGTPRVLNGQQTFNATVFYRPVGGGAATSQTATIQQQLTLNNPSGYFVSVTNTPTAAQVANGAPASGQAVGPQGVTWRAGSLTVTALPVFFTTQSGQTGTQSINVSLADAVSGQIAVRSASAAQGAAFTVTFPGKTAAYTAVPNTTNAGCQCTDGYTSPNAGAAPFGTSGGTAGTQVQIGGGANTVFVNAAGVVQATGPVIYIDNASPEPRAQFVGASFLLNGAGTSGFLNGTFDPSASISQAAAATALADNNGVDRVTRNFFFANTSAGLTASGIVSANQAAALTNGAFTVPTNVTPDQFVLAANLTDALGNAVALPVQAGSAAGGVFTFGVSTVAPTLGFQSGSSANNARFGAAGGTLTLIDSVVSPVGFGATNSLISVTRVSTNGTFCAQNSDVVAGQVTGATAAASGACGTVAANGVSINAATAAEGIYTITAQARDVAGNISATLTRTFVIDRTPPTIANPQPASLPIRGGVPQTFTAQATDNINLVTDWVQMSYPVASPFTLQTTGPAIATAFTTPFTTTANLSITTSSNFIRSVIEANATGGAFTGITAASLSGQQLVGSISVGVSDAGNNGAWATISASAVQALLDQTQPGNSFFSTTTTSGLQSVSITYTTTGGTTTTVPALGSTTTGTFPSVTLNIILTGPANTPFTSPFKQIDVYQKTSTPPGSPNPQPIYRFLGTATLGGLSVTPTTSTISNAFTFTPTSFPSSGTSTADLLVLAYDASGNAMAFMIPTLTINP